MQTKSLSPICLLPEITLKLKIFFNSSINAQGGETQKEACPNAQHHGVVQLRKSIKTNKNKDQGKLDLLLKKRRKKKMSWYLAIW